MIHTGDVLSSVSFVLVLMCAAPVPALAQPLGAGTAETAPAGGAQGGQAAWSRAMDALVKGDLNAALVALVQVDADASLTDERRAEARDLIQRIRRQQASSPAATVNPARGSGTAGGTGQVTGAPAPPAMAGAAADDVDDRGGRVFLLGTTTLAGLALWGWTLPTALGIENDRGYIGLYMLTAGASFGVPFMLTREGPATWGMANMTWLGATRGALAGLAVGGLIAGNSGSDAGRAGSLLLGSLLGATGGTLLARRNHTTPGAAHVVGIAGDIGALAGLGIAHITRLDQLDEDAATRDEDLRVRVMTGFALGGGTLGLLGGHLLARRGDFTWGDAEVMRLPSAIGVTGAAMIMDWSNTDSSQAIVGALMAGGLGGALVGERLVHKRDYAVGQAFLMDLGTLAGALVGMGSVYLITGSDRSETYLTSAFVGSTAAFSVLYLTLDAPVLRRFAARLTPKADVAPRVSVLPYIGGGAARGLALAGTF